MSVLTTSSIASCLAHLTGSRYCVDNAGRWFWPQIQQKQGSHRPPTSPPVCNSQHYEVTALRLAASATAHGLAAWLHLQAGCSSVTSAPLHMAHTCKYDVNNFSMYTAVQWMQFTGDVNKFTIFSCEIYSGLRVPKMVWINAYYLLLYLLLYFQFIYIWFKNKTVNVLLDIVYEKCHFCSSIWCLAVDKCSVGAAYLSRFSVSAFWCFVMI